MKSHNKVILTFLPLLLLASCGGNKIVFKDKANEIEFAKYNSKKDLDTSNLKFNGSINLYEDSRMVKSFYEDDSSSFMIVKDKKNSKYGVINTNTLNYVIEPIYESIKDLDEGKENYLLADDYFLYKFNKTYKIISSNGDILYEGNKFLKANIIKKTKTGFYYEIISESKVVSSGEYKNNEYIIDESPIIRDKENYLKDGSKNLASIGLDGYGLKINNDEFNLFKDTKLIKTYKIPAKAKEALAKDDGALFDGIFAYQDIVNKGEKHHTAFLDLLTGEEKVFDTNYGIDFYRPLKDENGIYKYCLIYLFEDNKTSSLIIDKDFNVYKRYEGLINEHKNTIYELQNNYYDSIGNKSNIYDSKMNLLKEIRNEFKLFSITSNLLLKYEPVESLNEYESHLYTFDEKPFNDIQFFDGGTFKGTNGLWYMDYGSLNILNGIDKNTYSFDTEESIKGLSLLDYNELAALFTNEEGKKILLTPDYELNELEGLENFTFKKLNKTNDNNIIINFDNDNNVLIPLKYFL